MSQSFHVYELHNVRDCRFQQNLQILLLLHDYRGMEWLALEGTLKIIYFQH